MTVETIKNRNRFKVQTPSNLKKLLFRDIRILQEVHILLRLLLLIVYRVLSFASLIFTKIKRPRLLDALVCLKQALFLIFNQFNLNFTCVQ